MDAEDFRQMALSLDGAEESSHMGAPDFRVGGRIFATLAMQHLGYGNLMLSPALAASADRRGAGSLPRRYPVVGGGWDAPTSGLADASAQQMLKGLQLAWNLRVEKNGKSRSSRPKRGRGKP